MKLMLYRLVILAVLWACGDTEPAPQVRPFAGVGTGPRAGPKVGVKTGPKVGANWNHPGEWERTTLTTIVTCKGADGVNVADYDGDGDLDIVTACEQLPNTIIVNRNDRPVDAAPGVRPTFTSIVLPIPAVGGTISGTEDAQFGDINGDGLPDVVIGEAIGRAIRWYKNNGTFGATPFDTPNMIVDGTWLWKHALVFAPGIVFACGYSNVPEVARFDCDDTPCLEASTWTHTKLTDAGDCRGLKVMNGDDLLVFDTSGGTTRGVRWIFDASTGTGSGTLRLVNQVDTLRGDITGTLVLHTIGSADAQSAGLRVNIIDSVTGATITGGLLPTNFGRLQTALWADINNDLILDIVLTASHAAPDPLCVTAPCDTGVSSVVALLGPLFTQRVEISGPHGIKHDNSVAVDLTGDGKKAIITTEEKYLGIVVYWNPL